MGIADQLSTHFQGASKKDWQTVASSETDQATSAAGLYWMTPDNLQFAPFYDRDDMHAVAYIQKFNFPGSSEDFVAAREWKNLPHVAVADEKHANALALDHLKHAADGILFSWTKPVINFQILLEKIEWPYCHVSFLVPDRFSPLPLAAYMQHKKYSFVSGNVFRRVISLKDNLVGKVGGLKSLGIFIESSTPVQEIVYALSEGVHTINSALRKKLPLGQILDAISFSIPVSGEFLSDIAKLKTLRLLWFQVAQAYGVSSYSPADLHIHTRALSWNPEKFQPHGNMLKSTVATMAAVAGGNNSHTVYPESENDSTQNRIARNVSLILKEESHFGKVADPLAGSYAVENMVHEIAIAAWKKFQEKVE